MRRIYESIATLQLDLEAAHELAKGVKVQNLDVDITDYFLIKDKYNNSVVITETEKEGHIRIPVVGEDYMQIDETEPILISDFTYIKQLYEGIPSEYFSKDYPKYNFLQKVYDEYKTIMLIL